MKLVAVITGAASSRPRRREPLRSLLVVLLIAAGGVGTALAPVAWWVHGLASDSHRYVNTVAPLAANTDLQTLVSTEVTARVSSALNLGSVTALQLPPALLGLLSGSGTVSEVLHHDIAQVVSAVVTGPQFPVLWATLNRSAHPSVAALLTGAHPSTGTVSVAGTQIVVNTTAVVDAVKAQLLSSGVPFAGQIPDTAAPLVLTRIAHLHRYQTVSALLDRTAWWLPWAAGGCFLLAVTLARRRRRALTGVGFTIILAMGVLTAARASGPSAITAHTSSHSRLLQAVFTTVTAPLQHTAAEVAAAGAVLLVLGVATQLLRTRPHPAGSQHPPHPGPDAGS